MFDDGDSRGGKDGKPEEDLEAVRERQRKALDEDVRRSRREQLQSRRMANISHVPGLGEGEGNLPEYSLDHLKDCPSGELLRQQIIMWVSSETRPEMLGTFLSAIESNDLIQENFGIIGLRKVLSSKTNQPIQQVMDHPAFFRILRMAQDASNPQLQLESAWCLANMASGTTEQTYSLIQKNIIEVFVNLIKSKYLQIVEQAVWGIGNIAGDCIEFRNRVMQSEVPDALLKCLQRGVSEKIRNLIIWVFSNLCRMRPPTERITPIIRPMLVALRDAFKTTNNPEVLNDAIYGFYGSGKPEANDIFLDQEFLAKLLRVYSEVQTDYTEQRALLTCLHTFLGGFTSDAGDYTLAVTKMGFLTYLKNSLFIPQAITVREVCWIISNMAIGEPEQVSAIIMEPNLLETLAKLTRHTEPSVAREATWVLCNLTLSKDENIIKVLIERGILNLFKEIMESDSESKMLTLCIEGLTNLIAFFGGRGKDYENAFVAEVIKQGLGKSLENLQYHKNDLIYFKAHMLIDQHFPIAN